ncbi:pirin domain containing protein [Grosmannia clavigera kw1407]|uniref:Pirin domain containing protein n=1 Tax=Grosmannia clavigera (strain kw1407 / UAMH 11150) TaxID=655863 RepID=F0XK06_GROCL|nr:pirin domain containing protein [Grosmannia clavigera kw1407]EFX01872.1 pirin domain containing protein [Grosmannia clavigera kw1407]
MSTDMSAKKALSEAATAVASSFQLPHATIRAHRSATRGHSNHGWLNTYHSFSFADWYNPEFMGFGSLRVLNEDTVQPQSGFPTHPHRDFEIFSYVLSGELTHRDSMVKRGQEAAAGGDRFFRVRRGDVQFTTGGTGIAHSEFNEHAADPVHFLQIWAVPWKRGLQPTYHNQHFPTEAKQAGGGTFVPILSPLAAGPDASAAEEAAAVPVLPGTIPIHADFAMGAALVAPSKTATWTVGLGAAGVVTKAARRKVFVHLPKTTTNTALGHAAKKPGEGARIRIADRDDAGAVLDEGDGAFVDQLVAGDQLTVENIGTAEAEVIVLDTA